MPGQSLRIPKVNDPCRRQRCCRRSAQPSIIHEQQPRPSPKVLPTHMMMLSSFETWRSRTSLLLCSEPVQSPMRVSPTFSVDPRELPIGRPYCKHSRPLVLGVANLELYERDPSTTSCLSTVPAFFLHGPGRLWTYHIVYVPWKETYEQTLEPWRVKYDKLRIHRSVPSTLPTVAQWNPGSGVSNVADF